MLVFFVCTHMHQKMSDEQMCIQDQLIRGCFCRNETPIGQGMRHTIGQGMRHIIIWYHFLFSKPYYNIYFLIGVKVFAVFVYYLACIFPMLLGCFKCYFLYMLIIWWISLWFNYTGVCIKMTLVMFQNMCTTLFFHTINFDIIFGVMC